MGIQAYGNLTILQAYQELLEMGFEVTPRQVQRYANEKRLPFFKGLDGRQYIQRNELHTFFQKRQLAAVREMGDS